MTRYQHLKIEPKWQCRWEESHAFSAQVDPSKPKYYVLDMYPYPSGAGLHVGHVLGYTATDIVARYKRQKGFQVLHPMGWDAFGLPAEQYAIRTGTHPAETTQKNIATYKRQLKALGLSYDWDREIATTDPKFYKWTQWIFTKLYDRGLAYEAEMLVNYCPQLGTVLANEEVESGVTKEGGFPVERRPVRQWMLKITAYADRLIDDLEELDWPESIKRHQRNWIGRREGAEVDFETGEHTISVFTRRVDTLFGVTYLVLAPEHPLVATVTTPEQKQAMEQYQSETAKKSDLQRTELEKDKTGAFTGAYAINPATGQPIPIWIADYVLAGYGTGAVMAVPAHDERDFVFARKYDLPIVGVVEPEDEAAKEAVIAGELCWGGEGHLIGSAHEDLVLNGLSIEAAKKEATQWLQKHGKGTATVNYRLRDWLFSRQRYWGEPVPILHLADGTTRPLTLDELPLLPPEVPDYQPTAEGLSPLANVPEWVNITDTQTGQIAQRETNTMPQWAGSCWYYLRFCDPSNDQAFCAPEKEQYWMPVDLYIGGAEHAVLHLLYARFWHKVLYDLGVVSESEPFKKLYNQGLITARSYRKKGGAYVSPEAACQVDGTYVLRETGEELESHIDKMSKSKLNVVTPDEIIEEFGADSLRLYEMFLGPLDKEKPWNTDGVTGCYRFLTRFYDLATGELSDEATDESMRLAHRTVGFVAKAIENLQFNTAIAKMMEFVNAFSKLSVRAKPAIQMVTQALAPFAPHVAEELWELWGDKGSIFSKPWPIVDPKMLSDVQTTYIIQVNGKLRGRLDLPKDQPQEAIVDAAKADSRVAHHLSGEIRKVIFVPNRLINFVF